MCVSDDGSCNFCVKKLVPLRSIAGVQSDRLMADEVVARLEGLWDGDGPRTGIVDHLSTALFES